MKWKTLNDISELDAALKASYDNPIVLFKHSTRCSISLMAKKTIERFWCFDIDAYFLDLIIHRDISNAIAEKLLIRHESPQLIIVKEGKAIYNASHGAIDVEQIKIYV